MKGAFSGANGCAQWLAVMGSQAWGLKHERRAWKSLRNFKHLSFYPINSIHGCESFLRLNSEAGLFPPNSPRSWTSSQRSIHLYRTTDLSAPQTITSSVLWPSNITIPAPSNHSVTTYRCSLLLSLENQAPTRPRPNKTLSQDLRFYVVFGVSVALSG